jgi:cyclopropane fatty-acyl-phospholipid synthase-like methyltransferase
MKKRTTAHLYNEWYFANKYEKWFKDGLNMDNKTIKVETEKKLNFISHYMPDVKSILVPGCSFGMLVFWLNQNDYEAEGIDVSDFALEKAPEESRKYLRKMSVTDMNEYSDNKFDLIAAFDIFEHLYYEEILKACKEASRVASKYILIRVPSPKYDAEPGIADYSSFNKVDGGHVSVYPYDFWVRRFVEVGKYDFWFASIWNRPRESETWIAFRRKK